MLSVRVELQVVTRESAGEPEERHVLTFKPVLDDEHNSEWIPAYSGPVPFNLTMTVNPDMGANFKPGKHYVLEFVEAADDMEETSDERSTDSGAGKSAGGSKRGSSAKRS